MLKKLNFALITLLSIFIFSCNFTFNDPKTLTQTASLSISCGSKNARTISEKDKQEGILKIHILGEKTNHYVYREGKTNSTFYFDLLPEDTYLIKVDFYASNILKATAEDFVEIKAFNTKSITLTLIEVNSRFEGWSTSPEIISEWSKLKTEIENMDSEYNCYKLSNTLTVTDTIAVNRKVRLIPSEGTTYIKAAENLGDNQFFSINTSEGVELVINNIAQDDRITFDAMAYERTKPVIENRNVLTLENVTFQNIKSTGSGGAIQNSGILNLKNCEFSNCEADKGAGIYMTSGELNMSEMIENTSITTKTNIDNTPINELVYIISDSDLKLTFKDNCLFENVTMFIQNNTNPNIIVDDTCEGTNSYLYFNSKPENINSLYSNLGILFSNIY